MKKIRLKKNHKEKSNRWLKRHLNDPFFQEAKKSGFRSRSAFKLLQINEKFNFFFKGAKTIDLGAAPGGWSQVAKKLSSPDGNVLGLDLLSIDPINGIKFLKGDINDNNIHSVIRSHFNVKVDIILSDMAPNTSGHSQTDHLRIINLAEMAVNFSEIFLKKNGFFVCKVFQGGAQGKLLESMQNSLKDIKYMKPLASRKESSETYLFAVRK